MASQPRNRILGGTSHVLADPVVEDQLEQLYYEAQVRADAAAHRDGAVGDFGFSLRPAQGELAYLLARATGAKCIVCLPVSAGASVLYLGAALRDNGGGTILGLEPRDEFAARARRAVADTGLTNVVDIRSGDPVTALRAAQPATVDLALIDGWPNLSAPSTARLILEALADCLRPGAMIVNDNQEPDYRATADGLGMRSLATPFGYLSVAKSAAS